MNTEYSINVTKNKLAEAYIHNFSNVESFYEYNIKDAAHLEERANWLDQADHKKADRDMLVKALLAYNTFVDNEDAALQHIHALKQHDALVVIGGQQAGLFTGPMMVMHKAITIIQHARAAAKTLKRPVIPVFWIAGEDHDWAEVNHTYVMDKSQQPCKLTIAKEDENNHSSISYVDIHENEWHKVITDLADILPETDFKDSILDKLYTFSKQSTNLSDFFARVMSWLFGKYGLVLVDAADQQMRSLQTEMFLPMIQQSNEVNALLSQVHDQLQAAGFQPEASVQEQSMNMFFVKDGKRKLLFRDGKDIFDKKKQWHLDIAQLEKYATHEPWLLSNNVFTRPIMQEYVFPVLKTVLGPSELAYWGMLKDVFQQFQMKLPILIPRQEYTMVEKAIQKHMTKYDLTVEDVFFHFDEKKEAWLRKEDTLQLQETFASIKAQFSDLYNPVVENLQQINEGIYKLGQKNSQKIIEQIDYLASKAYHAQQSQSESSIKQWNRIQNSLIPMGKKWIGYT
ncbi:bacillithiol biosynthesis cysteine-adding enzyme BshC [Longirhabdus pacifica]|uniref:bacillithiol biosynthesis cysteine-adding enzyme BshC n=1 Tax=Longirhabdus pacifica TaxID=2305227 RepID=UPI00100924A6|nr:bacillithiol biosynthesis cysteine-adding enzyme BshC [Longirhabdus pacifica]